jgi:transglutaminase-like putative cysteine protease
MSEPLSFNRRTVSLASALGAITLFCALTAFASCLQFIRIAGASVFAALVILALVMDITGSRRPHRMLVNIIALCVLLYTLKRINTQDLIETFTEAMLILAAVKMLEKKRSRDYLQILALSFLSMFCSAILSVGGAALFYLFLFSLIAPAALILASWLKEEEGGARLEIGGLANVSAGAFFMWAAMLPVCFLIFLAAPRMELDGARFSVRGEDGSVSTGFSDKITLGEVSRIQKSAEIAFRATMPRVPGPNRYWRGITLERFTGDTWYDLGERERFDGGDIGENIRVSGPRVSQRILLEPGRHKALFALDVPIAITPEGMSRMDLISVLDSDRDVAQRISYTAESALASALRHDGRFGRSGAIYLAVPHGFGEPIMELTDEITSGIEPWDSEARVNAIMAYLSQPMYEYTLDDLPASQNALEDFIFSHRRGNCEFFASAAAMMMRFASVPSRLVVGYYGGEYNEGGDYYTVRQNNAHVWVEAWYGGAWNRLDPTPISTASEMGAESSAYSAFREAIRLRLDTLSYYVTVIFVEYGRDKQSTLLRGMGGALENARSAIDKTTGKISLAALKARSPHLAAAAAVIMTILYAARRFSRKKKSREERLIDEFMLVMKGKGFVKTPGDGMEEIAGAARAVGDELLTAAVNGFVSRFEELYFNDIPMSESDEIELREILRAILRRIEKIKARRG